MISNQFSNKLKRFKNALNHYLGLEVPIWMQSRKSLFIFFCIDFLLFIFIKNLKIELFNDFRLLSNAILYSLLWCLIGYVNGKYSYFKDIKKTYGGDNSLHKFDEHHSWMVAKYGPVVKQTINGEIKFPTPNGVCNFPMYPSCII